MTAMDDEIISQFVEENADLPFDASAHREAFTRLVEMGIDRRSWRAILTVRQELVYSIPMFGRPVRVLCLDKPSDDILKMSVKTIELYRAEEQSVAEAVCDDVVTYVARHFPGRCLNRRDSASAVSSQGNSVYAMFFTER